MRLLKYLIILAIVVVSAAAIGSLLLLQIRGSFSYGVRAEFKELPPNDKELQEWLAVQPGVVKVSMFRDKNAIQVYWIIVQDLNGNPPTPHLPQEFERFGYRGLINYDGNWKGD